MFSVTEQREHCTNPPKQWLLRVCHNCWDGEPFVQRTDTLALEPVGRVYQTQENGKGPAWPRNS